MALPIGDMEEEKPEEGSRATLLAGLVKGCLPKLNLEDFPVEPEKVCQKFPVFIIIILYLYILLSLSSFFIIFIYYHWLLPLFFIILKIILILMFIFIILILIKWFKICSLDSYLIFGAADLKAIRASGFMTFSFNHMHV